MKRLLLIDGNSILFRAYYATAGMGNLMVNKDGIPTNGVYGFIMMINRLLENKPDYIYIAFDAHRKTFRNELMADYKGTRKETPEELVVQFDIVKEYLDAANIPYYQKDGYEADDLIGTMATIAKNHDIDVEIVTGDKDMLQLVDDHITVLRTSKGVTDLNVMTPEAVKEKFGVEPAQIQDLLGLMGDTADNIPGIKGVGEKTAVKLLNSYGSVEGIKEHAGEIKGKMGEKVRENIDTGVLSKQIATILTDVPLDDEDIEHYHYQDYDYDTLSAFFRKYDMNSLLRRISRPDTARETMEFKVVEKVPEIRDHSSLVAVCYDENYHRSIVLGYAIYHPDQSFYIEYEKAIEDEKFKDYLKDKNIHKYGYDMKKCILASRWNQMNIEGYDFDLKLAAYVLDPGIKDEIKDVADYLEYDGQLSYDDEILGKGAKKHIPELSEISKHAILQAKAVYDLHDTILDKIKANGQEELYQLELEVSDILTEMEYTGTKLDVDVLKELEKEFESKAETLEKSIYEDAGVEFNISSPKQLGEVLFEKLQLPYSKKTKTGYSTSADVLEKLVGRHPIIQKILDYRAVTKLNSTYIKGLQQRVFPDGKIHTIYNQALTQTGRLSSIDPNLQNISVKTEEGRMIRKAFVPAYDYLISFDYSQIELRVLASLADVTALIEAFNEGLDIHTHTASTVFKVPMDEVTSIQRRNAKAVNFGIIYGMSDYGLAEQIGVSLSEAKAYIDEYYASYPEIRTYMNKQIDLADKQGYVETILHRRRYIPEIHEKNHMRRELGKRLAMNTPIQGSGADIIKLAMVRVDKRMKEEHLQSKMILQVHDELIFDVVEDELDIMLHLVQEEMEGAYQMKVTLKVEGNYGKNWCELK